MFAQIQIVNNSLRINFSQCVRFLSTGITFRSRSYTRESRVRPGSSEAKEPLKWAKRIFDQHQLKEITFDPPHMLNMVVLTSTKQLPYYCKAILNKYNLLDKCFKYQIVKNVPSVNDDLKKVASWIKVVPLKFPNGVPQTTKDLLNAQLRPDGSMILHTGKVIDGTIVEKIESLKEDDDDQQKAKALIYGENEWSKKSLTVSENTRDHMKDWRRNRFLKSYFASHYQYKHNQDGKEYRYSNMHRLRDSLKQSADRRFNEDGTVRMNDCLEADWNTYPWRFY